MKASDRALVTGLILCGGEGSRMGGADKGLVPFHGRLLVDIAMERLSPQVGSIMISANRNLSEYEQRGHRVLRDEPMRDGNPGYEGPLAGILTGLKVCPTPWLMVLPCDAPMFPQDIVAQLWSRVFDASPDATEAKPIHTAAHIEGHPTFALVHRDHLHSLELFLQHGERKLGKWLELIGSIAHDSGSESSFRNLNTPEDLR